MPFAKRVPWIAIVVPTFDRAALLERCLESLRRQDDSAWECVVVDDGSTDDIAARVARLAARDPRIRLVRQSNRGPSAARNAGIAASTAPWLAFMDSDDYYLPGALSTLRKARARVPSAAVVCGGLAGPMRVDRRRAMNGRIGVRDQFWDALGVELVRPRVQLIAAAFEREAVSDVGAFDPRYRVSEDREFMIRVTARYPVATIRKDVAYYDEGHGEGASDRSLVDGSKLAAHRQMYSALAGQPALAPRYRSPEDKARLDRLVAAQLQLLDAIELVREGDYGAGAAALERAAGACVTLDELDALLVKCAYFLYYPAARPRQAATNAATALGELARYAREPSLARSLSDSATFVKLWAALVLWRSQRRPAAAAAAVSLVGSVGVRGLVGPAVRRVARRPFGSGRTQDLPAA